MNILMTGGTGFIGKTVSAHLIRKGHQVTVLTRRPPGRAGGIEGISYLQGDPTQKGKWQEAVPASDIIINLAGASIFSRWSEEQKRTIRESRIHTTRNLVEALPLRPDRAMTLLSASAVGYYGSRGEEELTEEAPPGKGFLAKVCEDWEGEASKAGEKGIRVAMMRFGIVLGEEGGALGQMVPLFRHYLGGPIGSGRQWFSWIHLQDLEEAILFLMSHPEVSGPVNFCTPHPLRNQDLARALGKALHRPSFLRVPAFALRMLLGEFGSVLLEGQRVIPRKLLAGGFTFRYPEVEEALRDLAFRLRL
ncbi:MAG: TIGR01777 family oxidoreductase [candidate division NC10 bacterium]|nr:TIGR01777 family oxidoreductase [candidate division NC10 bacterium]